MVVGIFLLFSLMVTGRAILARTYGNDQSGVRNTEQWHQLSYFGEAWTQRAGQSARISYRRNGVKLKTISVYKGNWRRDSYKCYNSGIVWDSLNPVAPKTTFIYSY